MLFQVVSTWNIEVLPLGSKFRKFGAQYDLHVESLPKFKFILQPKIIIRAPEALREGDPGGASPEASCGPHFHDELLTRILRRAESSGVFPIVLASSHSSEVDFYLPLLFYALKVPLGTFHTQLFFPFFSLSLSVT